MKQDKKVVVDRVTKIYNIYDSPMDRLKESFSRRCRHTEFYALRAVSFEVAKGEIVGIMGQNGAGKSTLLKIITGVLKPTSGEVRVAGRISSLLELGAGFNMEYSGIDNIYFYGTIMGLSRSEMSERVEDILSFAEIGDYINQPVKTYSSGMFARLAFSCAINVDPDVLIVDEILSVGDIRFQAKCFNKFKEFKRKGVTILYVGHDISTMRSFCDHCIWLNQGEIVDSGDPAHISAKYMKFMYMDGTEEAEDFADAREPEADAPSAEETEAAAAPDEKQEQQAAKGKPIAHWGSMPGQIFDVSLQCGGQDVISCDPMDTIVVSFSIPYIEGVDYEHLAVSASVKSREGLDYITKTTYDAGIRLQPGNREGHTFHFAFQPRLANGDYYLALGLESHKDSIISYYEYIEGAVYFKVFRDERQYGQFFPDINIEIQGDCTYGSI